MNRKNVNDTCLQRWQHRQLKVLVDNKFIVNINNEDTKQIFFTHLPVVDSAAVNKIFLEGALPL